MLVYFNPLAFTAQLASFERTPRSSIAGPSSSIRLLQNSNNSGKPVETPAPIDIRSFISVVSDTFQPSLAAPRRCTSGIFTSVKYTSLNSDWPLACLIGLISTPGAFMSRKNMVSPLCFGTLGSVRVRRMP